MDYCQFLMTKKVCHEERAHIIIKNIHLSGFHSLLRYQQKNETAEEPSLNFFFSNVDLKNINDSAAKFVVCYIFIAPFRLLQASCLPMSIIIVGVGPAEFDGKL